MTREELVVGLVRFLGALPVLRWPFTGAIIAILVDLADLVCLNYLDLGGGGLRDYQAFDKVADLFYLVTFLIVALRWRGIERRVAIALFALRLIGVAAFELTGARPVLFAFPNAFELWFLCVAFRDRSAPDYALTPRRTAIVLAVVWAAKWGQEYLLHIDRRLDHHSLRLFVSEVWQWLVRARHGGG